MKFFQSLSLKRKQSLLILLTSSVALLLACAGFATYDVVTFRGALTERLATLAQVLGNNSSAALEYNYPKDAEEVLSALQAEPHIVTGLLYKDGQIFASYHRPDSLPALPSQPAGPRSDSKRLVLHQDVLQQGEIIGSIYLESDLRALDARLRQYAAISAIVLPIAMLGAFLLSARLQRYISGPILQLVTATRTVTEQKNYSVRVPKESRDELGQLIDSFNEMLAQIQLRDDLAQQANDTLEKRVIARTGELQGEILERRRAEERLRQQFTRVTMLNEVARAAVEGHDLGRIFSVLLHSLEVHLAVDFGAVYLFDRQRDCLVVATHGPKSEPRARQLGENPGQPLDIAPAAKNLCLQGQKLLWTQTAASHSPLAERLAQVGLLSGAMAPLLAEGKVLGLLVVARETPSGLDSSEAEFLCAVSEQVALAARQAQLHAELQQAYDELRATQQAVLQQERLRALGQMASGIAHDINNALSPIVLSSDLILVLEPNLSPEARRLVDSIKTAGRDISGTVARMREFYRHRQQNEPLFQIDVTAVLNQAIELTRPRWRDIPQQGGAVVQLRLELASQLPLVLGCESEIRQSIINLILNAVDAMPQGGLLTLRSRLRTDGPTANTSLAATSVCLEVSDTGIGMDEETRRRCLEPFFSTKGARGTGLGLATVYGVMQRHSGHIEIESALGQGTTMRLVFPVSAATAPVPNPAVEPLAPTLPSLRLLCIDDESGVLDVLRLALTNLGHQVTARESGIAGLEAFRQARATHHPFDAVITDLGMPVMDGRAVAQAVKNASPQTPVILLTGWGMFMKSAADQPPGVDCILSKPPTLEDLNQGLRSVLPNRRV